MMLQKDSITTISKGVYNLSVLDIKESSMSMLSFAGQGTMHVVIGAEKGVHEGKGESWKWAHGCVDSQSTAWDRGWREVRILVQRVTTPSKGFYLFTTDTYCMW